MKKQREVILLSGRTGTGKSTLARKLYLQFPRRVIYDPQHEHEEKSLSRLHSFNPFHITTQSATNAASLAWLAGNCVLVIDDAYAYMRHPLETDILRVVKEGRHRAVSIIAVTQRLPDVAPDLRSEVDVMIAFKAVMQSDIDRLEREWGFRQSVGTLTDRNYHWLKYTERTLQAEKVLRFFS